MEVEVELFLVLFLVIYFSTSHLPKLAAICIIVS